MLTYGAKKYDVDNWRKGFDFRGLLDSLERHLLEFKDGKDFDEESGLPTLAHIAANVAFLIEHSDQGLGRDDRIKLTPGQSLRFKNPPKRK